MATANARTFRDATSEDEELQEIRSESSPETSYPGTPSSNERILSSTSVVSTPTVDSRQGKPRNRKYPPPTYFDVRYVPLVYRINIYISYFLYACDLAFFAWGIALVVQGRDPPYYALAYSSLLTFVLVLRLLDKWYRVQGGFDDFNSLLSDFTPGAFGLIIALWGNTKYIILAVNIFSVLFSSINFAIALFQPWLKNLIKGDVKKYLWAKQVRDRYDDIGLSGLLPCNEATNKITESATHGWYYTLVETSPPSARVETPPASVESGLENSPTHVGKTKFYWLIGTMMVSYSDNGQWVTIKQKAEDRGVKTFMEPFSPAQKVCFLQMMDAWEERPGQGILKKIGKRSHCFTLARLIDLTAQGYSLQKEYTNLDKIVVGAEVDGLVEDYLECFTSKVMQVVSKVGMQWIVAILGVIVVLVLHMI